MTKKLLKKQYGIVMLLDALGASTYSDNKIRKFLAARAELNNILSHQAKQLNNTYKTNMPTTHTFGDTLIVAAELNKKRRMPIQIMSNIVLMQEYLYHSLEEGILFRGAFSIGSYIEDSKSNTVMGTAISDAASWYEKSDWIGISSTPQTNSILEFHLENKCLNDPKFLHYYPVPMKNGREIDLYTISWAGRFFIDDKKKINHKKRFLGMIKDQTIPLGSESKYINTKKYFNFIEDKITKDKVQAYPIDKKKT